MITLILIGLGILASVFGICAAIDADLRYRRYLKAQELLFKLEREWIAIKAQDLDDEINRELIRKLSIPRKFYLNSKIVK